MTTEKSVTEKKPYALRMYESCCKVPIFGKTLFSLIFSWHCPYFLTIRASIEDVKPGFAQVSVGQRWMIQNHINTIHAIAVCNLIEMTMGLVVEASVPSTLRWLPMGMDVNYLKKATGKLTATASIDEKTFFKLDKYPGQVVVHVDVKNQEGVVVTNGDVRIWLSEKDASKKKTEKKESQPASPFLMMLSVLALLGGMLLAWQQKRAAESV